MLRRTCVTTSAALALSVAALAPAARAEPAAPLVIGHRGAAGLAPENTLEAVERAHRAGTSWVEADVQRSKDGVLVLMHDQDLARTTDAEEVFPRRAPWKVGDFTYAELNRLRAGASPRWKGSRYETARVPTLGQLLDRLDRTGQGLLLELKWPGGHPGVVRDTLRVLGRKGWLDAHHVHHRLYVISFLPAALRSVREERPDIRLGICDERVSPGELASYARFADSVNPEHTATTGDFVRRAHALEGPHGTPLKVWPYTVNTAGQARRLRDLRVDGFTTDVPDAMRRALGR
ncbi:glycerophosphodiester phosphodiesterase [Streptomyces sp. NPDC017936]|uniref:glycerophosphodiester phosphodiesterase n=1 Tax=Streptomyces sp. NPDC017936 TaxID=3365016 RepID=UPI0037AC3E35